MMVSTFTRGRSRSVLRVIGIAGTAAALAWAGTGSASAVAGDTAAGSTSANVAVSTSIALTGVTPSFLLTGVPGATVLGTGAVTMNVVTNNLAGYSVTVASVTATMAGTGGNTDTIPIGALSVRETGTTPFTAMSTAATTVHTQATRSLLAGDVLSNDYQVVIPFVNENTYSATLNYIATTL